MVFEVVVEFKPEVLDVQGRAVAETLHRLLDLEVDDLRVSKRFVVRLKEGTLDPQNLVEKIAREFLSSSVSETFFVRELFDHDRKAVQ